MIRTAGDPLFAKITRATIIAGRDRRSATPAQARHFLETMRGLFKWVAKASFVRGDPTIGVEDPARPKNGGFPVWTEEQVAAYERRWPIGTRQRVWLDVLLYTGLRRGDAVRLGRQHIRNGVATIKTEKSGFTLEVTLPILPVLAETLSAGPCGELTFIVGVNGKPLDKRSFGNQFRKGCRAAGVNRSAHGLRKIAATRAANAGATVGDGPEDVWHRSTRAPLIGVGWQSKACTFLRTMSELLFPHLKVRCGRQMKKANNFNADKRVCRGSDKWNNVLIPNALCALTYPIRRIETQMDFG